MVWGLHTLLEVDAGFTGEDNDISRVQAFLVGKYANVTISIVMKMRGTW